MNVHFPPPDAHTIARAVDGKVFTNSKGTYVVASAPGHSAKDRSMTILVGPEFPDGFWVTSHAGDDPIALKDYVNQKLGSPRYKPQSATESIAETYDAKPRRANGQRYEKPLETKPFWDGSLARAGFKQAATYDYAVEGNFSSR